MKISKTYSHLNGEEFLLVHHKQLYKEIKEVIGGINAEHCKTKISREKKNPGKLLYSPKDLNEEFKKGFNGKGWNEDSYYYYITHDRELMEASLKLERKEQKKLFERHGIENPILSYNQTDFVKNQVAVEVQFGKYAFVAYDLFVKHMMFYSGGKINVGIEILPMKNLQAKMSSGVAYFEGEVYNVIRQGRTSPPVPLLIIGIDS